MTERVNEWNFSRVKSGVVVHFDYGFAAAGWVENELGTLF